MPGDGGYLTPGEGGVPTWEDDPRSEVERLREELVGNGMEDKGLRRYYAEAKELSLYWCDRAHALEARLNEARAGIHWALQYGQPETVSRHLNDVLASITGGDPLVGPAVCYACPMFEGAAHMPDAANHRPDPEGDALPRTKPEIVHYRDPEGGSA